MAAVRRAAGGAGLAEVWEWANESRRRSVRRPEPRLLLSLRLSLLLLLDPADLDPVSEPDADLDLRPLVSLSKGSSPLAPALTLAGLPPRRARLAAEPPPPAVQGVGWVLLLLRPAAAARLPVAEPVSLAVRLWYEV